MEEGGGGGEEREKNEPEIVLYYSAGHQMTQTFTFTVMAIAASLYTCSKKIKHTPAGNSRNLPLAGVVKHWYSLSLQIRLGTREGGGELLTVLRIILKASGRRVYAQLVKGALAGEML